MLNWIRTIIARRRRRAEAESLASRRIRIRALMFAEGGRWRAQCLEYDIAVQARSLSELRDELMRVLETRMQASLEKGQKPFAGLRKAPKKFWQMYEATPVPEEATKQVIHAKDPGAGASAQPLPHIVSTFKVITSAR